MSLAVRACDECIHFDVCFGRALLIQFADEIGEAMEKYLDRTGKLLFTSHDEWFGVYVNCKYFQRAGEKE